MTEIKPMMKSFTFYGSNGNQLVLSETSDRQEIVVSIQRVSDTEDHLEITAVRIDAEQFGLLCRLDSAYDGLQCEPAKPEQLELVGLADAAEAIDAEFDEVGEARREE